MFKIKKFANAFKELLGGKKEAPSEPKATDHLMTPYKGEVCRVLNEKNTCFYVGEIGDYDVINNVVKIPPYRNDYIPTRTHYNDFVKLYIQNQNHITTIYGRVKQQSSGYWKIEVSEVVQHSNQREAFRQVISRPAKLQQEGLNDDVALDCELVDISLSGVCICCEQELHPDKKISLSGVSLYPDAPKLYDFDCMICRTFQPQEISAIETDTEDAASAEDASTEAEVIPAITPSKYYYGCVFLQLSPDDRADLHQDIFLIQKRERQSELW